MRHVLVFAILLSAVMSNDLAFGAHGNLSAVYDDSGRKLDYVQRSDTGQPLAIDSPLWLVKTEAEGVISSINFVPVRAKQGAFKHEESGLLCSVSSKVAGHFIRHFYSLEASKAVIVKRFVGMALPPEFSAGATVPGSPLVKGDWFAGMEYPTAQTALGGRLGMSTQFAQCNRALEPGERLQYSSVIGHAVSHSLRRGVLEYVEASRARKYKPYLHYNSWYDISEQGSDGTFVMDSDQCLAVMKAWERDFIEPYGVRLNGFVFDDGWDDYDNLWGFHRGRFPDGFAPQAKLAREMGTTIGTWFSPFGGYGATKAARLKSARRDGYEINSSGLSLSGEKYYKRFYDTCTEMIKTYEVNSFKFDGVGGCPSADMEAACRLMAELRQIKPELYINLTTGTWGSPFFLLHGDSIWRGGSDAFTWGDKGPMTHRLLNYRDGNTYKNIIKQSPLFPINSLMLCGMVYSQYGLGRTSVDKTDKSFADQAYSFFATGTQLQELYVSQKVMTKRKWAILADAVKWAHANAETLRDTHWIGGDPYQYEVYGHASFDYRGVQKDQPYKAIVSLRNPSEKTVDYELSLADVIAWDMENISSWEVSRRVYGLAPAVEDKDKLKIKLAPFSVELLELDVIIK
jgi:hypothetical protein